MDEGSRTSLPCNSLSDCRAQVVVRDRGIAVSTRSAVIEPVQFINRECPVAKSALRPQLVDEHLSERSNAGELSVFDEREPAIHIRDGAAQALIGKLLVGRFAHRPDASTCRDRRQLSVLRIIHCSCRKAGTRFLALPRGRAYRLPVEGRPTGPRPRSQSNDGQIVAGRRGEALRPLFTANRIISLLTRACRLRGMTELWRPSRRFIELLRDRVSSSPLVILRFVLTFRSFGSRDRKHAFAGRWGSTVLTVRRR